MPSGCGLELNAVAGSSVASEGLFTPSVGIVFAASDAFEVCRGSSSRSAEGSLATGFFDQKSDDSRTRLELSLTHDEALHLPFDAVLIDELPARHLVEAQAKRRETILIGILHLGFAIEKPRQHVIAKHEIAGGGGDKDRARPEQSAKPEERQPRNFDPTAFLAAGQMQDIISAGGDELIRLRTRGHLTFPAQTLFVRRDLRPPRASGIEARAAWEPGMSRDAVRFGASGPDQTSLRLTLRQEGAGWRRSRLRLGRARGLIVGSRAC